jgi:hypothetical protein
MFKQNKLTRIFFISTLIFSLASCSSKGQKFKIDNSISHSIDSTFKANILFDSPIKPEFSFHVRKTFDFEKFGQNGMDLAYFLKADSYNSTDVYSSSITECNLNKDTIVLVGGLFYNSGIAFRITIFGDNFNSQLLLTETEKVYSKTNNKDNLEKEIILNSDSLSMTLTQKPIFKIGNSVKGKIKIKSDPFYQLDKDSVLFKIIPEFDIIFDTKIKEKEKD